MKRKIDGWCAWHPERRWSMNCYGSMVLVHAKDPKFVEGTGGSRMVPVHIVDASKDSEEVVIKKETWEKLMAWCRSMVEARERVEPPLYCDDTLDFILSEVEK